MKRIVVISIAVAALAGSGIGVLIASPASASSAVSPAGIVGAHATQAVVAGPISSGATYTYYEIDAGPGFVPCEVLTFGTKTFAGSKGDQGKYKSTNKKLTVTFQNGASFYAGTFTGTFETADADLEGIQEYGGSFKLGAGTADPGKSYGPDALVEGNDTWSAGDCSSTT
jgi:hypothetical protein